MSKWRFLLELAPPSVLGRRARTPHHSGIFLLSDDSAGLKILSITGS